MIFIYVLNSWNLNEKIKEKQSIYCRVDAVEMSLEIIIYIQSF